MRLAISNGGRCHVTRLQARSVISANTLNFEDAEMFR